MPLYEYECKKCHHRFERIVKFSDPPMKKCPDCGGRVEQMISAPAVQFKGSGWYVTDYAKKTSAPSSSSSDGSSGSKEGSKGDSGAKGDSSGKGDSGAKAESSAKKEEKSKPDSSRKESSSKRTEKK